MIPTSTIIEFKNSLEDVYRYNGYVLKKEYYYNAEGDIWLLEYDKEEEIVVLPEGIWGVNSTAFDYNKNVRKITIPSSVKYMLYSQFKTCPNLREMILPDNCNEIYLGDVVLREEISPMVKFYTTSGDTVIIDTYTSKFKII